MKSNMLTGIAATALVMCAGTTNASDRYTAHGSLGLYIGCSDSGSEITDLRLSAFVKDANGGASGVCADPSPQVTFLYTTPDEIVDGIDVESGLVGTCSTEYGRADLAFFNEGLFGTDIYDGQVAFFWDQVTNDTVSTAGYDFLGASISVLEISGEYDPTLSGELTFQYCGVIDTTECSAPNSVVHSGRRAVVLHGVTHSNGGAIDDDHYDWHEITTYGDSHTNTFPIVFLDAQVEHSVSGTEHVDSRVIVACFVDAALDISGDGRFSQTDVDMIDALSSMDPLVDAFDIDGDSDITNWDVDAFQWIIDIGAGSGLLGDGDGDEDLDCDDYDLALAQPFAGEYSGDMSGDYKVEFDADLDGDNDSADETEVFKAFRSFTADWAEDYGTLDIFDVNAFNAAYTNQEDDADLALPYGTWDVFDVFAYLDLYDNGDCP